jgi:hypothetical protein
MAMDAIINASVLPRSADRKPSRRNHEMLEVLVSGLAATSRMTQLHAISMLEEVPDLKREEEQPLIFCIIRGTSLTILLQLICSAKPQSPSSRISPSSKTRDKLG